MKRKLNWELILKTIIFGIVFILIMLVLALTNLPNSIKDITSKIGADIYEPPVLSEWLTLLFYRLFIYSFVPLIASIFEIIFIRAKEKKGIFLINFEAQFLSFSIMNSLFYFLSLDYIFKANIFSIYDSIVTLLMFVVTILFDKKMPYIFLKEKGD